MVSSRIFFSLLAVPAACAALAIACGDDTSTAVPSADGGTSSSSGESSSSSGSTSSSGNTTSSSSGSVDQDSGADAGSGPCGTPPFGKPLVQFQGIVDASDNGAYQGGVLGQATYDGVIAERLSAIPGSWRETFVASANNRFARIRENDNDGGGAKPTSYSSGTYSADGGQLLLTFDCEFSGDAAVTGNPTDNIPFEVVTIDGKTYYRYGGAGVRFWLERR